jgi:FtsZ-interacting cell division protein YlmF
VEDDEDEEEVEEEEEAQPLQKKQKQQQQQQQQQANGRSDTASIRQQPGASTSGKDSGMNRVGQNHTFIGIYGVCTVILAGR